LKKRYEIKILGQQLAVLSDAEDEEVNNIVRYVNDKMEEIMKSSSGLRTLDVAILAALNISEEFLKLKGVSEDLRDHLERRSEQLIQLIENVS
jgi:cell division protein ZapA